MGDQADSAQQPDGLWVADPRVAATGGDDNGGCCDFYNMRPAITRH